MIGKSLTWFIGRFVLSSQCTQFFLCGALTRLCECLYIKNTLYEFSNESASIDRKRTEVGLLVRVP